MPISYLLKKIAMNKHKHIALKGGRVVYHSGAKWIKRGMGTVAKHHTGGEIAPHLSPHFSRLSMGGEGTKPPPKNFKRTKKTTKPINFNF
jgi:hypothetical protein